MTLTFTTVESTPLLQSLTSTGKPKFWIGRVVTDGTNCYTQSESWQVAPNGTESKHVISEPSLATPKNVGKKNATTPESQARSELQTAFDKKVKAGYTRADGVGEAPAKVFTLPMLAHKFEEKSHTVKYPVLTQPKYNGVRCLYDSELGLWSRLGNEFLPEVTAHIRAALPDTQGRILDGELMLPTPDFTFQETISAVKKFDPARSPLLQYIVYDQIDPAQQFIDRWNDIANMRPVAVGPVKLSGIATANDSEEIERQHRELVLQGYEGIIVRDPWFKYRPGQRTIGILKDKLTYDKEYKVVGFTSGRGKEANCITFVCVTEAGEEFESVPTETLAKRKEWFKRGKEFIGKFVTVRYRALTDAGVPFHQNTIAVRDYE